MPFILHLFGIGKVINLRFSFFWISTMLCRIKSTWVNVLVYLRIIIMIGSIRWTTAICLTIVCQVIDGCRCCGVRCTYIKIVKPKIIDATVKKRCIVLVYVWYWCLNTLYIDKIYWCSSYQQAIKYVWNVKFSMRHNIDLAVRDWILQKLWIPFILCNIRY